MIQQFVLKYFERILVLLLVASLLVINSLIEQKLAFLSFYYLPIILAGFYGGRRFAVVSRLFIALLVFSALITIGGYVHTDRFVNQMIQRHLPATPGI